MKAGLRFQTVASCAGGLVFFLAFTQNEQSAWAQTTKSTSAFQNTATTPNPLGYSALPDPAPSVRQVVILMPTRLSVERRPGRLSVGFDRAALRKVKIAVDENMSIGVKYEMRVYAKGDARAKPQQRWL